MVKAPVHIRLAAFGVAMAMTAAAPAWAQNANPPVGAGQQPAAGNNPQNANPQNAGQQNAPVQIPASVLSGLLVGTPEAMLALKQYLASVSKSPDQVSQRALDVVRQLKDSGLVRDPALLVAAAERVTRTVKETLSSAKIVKLKVDRNYKPPPGTIALDFAPPDAQVREGFQRVLPTDGMVKGEELQAIRRPGDTGDMLADGISGVENVEVPLPDGEYRVTVMTESLGDATTSLSPFGQRISANGESIDVLQATPDAWLDNAVLSNQGLSGANNATQREGGAVTMTVRVTGGKLNMNFSQGVNAVPLKTYLTGMIIEPADQPSSVTVEPEVRETLVTPPEEQTRYESQLASSLSTLFDDVSPEAGPEQQQDDLLKPVQTVQQTSPN